jgi:hypothetical protein
MNLMSGISGVTVQARDIDGGIHFHLTVPDPSRDDAARQVELSEETAHAVAAVLGELDTCLAALEVREADLPTAVDQVARTVLLRFRQEYDPGPVRPPPMLTPALRRLASDIAAYVEPERLLARPAYLSVRKVVAFYRAYQNHLPDEESSSLEQRFLALHRYFRANGGLVFGPARPLTGPRAPDSDTWVFFTGEFTLSRDDHALGSIPSAREALESGNIDNLPHVITALFGAQDPFFYPYVEFRGRAGAVEAAMTVSRKYLVLNSSTVTTLADAIRGAPLTVAGFGTLAPPDSGVMRIHPILFRANDAA